MYGFSKKMDISGFLHDSINIFGVYAYGVVISFHNGNSISLQGHYQIHDSEMKIVDDCNCDDILHKKMFNISPILNKKISNVDIIEPEKMVLLFEDGFSFTIIDDNPNYECCTINGNIVV